MATRRVAGGPVAFGWHRSGYPQSHGGHAPWHQSAGTPSRTRALSPCVSYLFASAKTAPASAASDGALLHPSRCGLKPLQLYATPCAAMGWTSHTCRCVPAALSLYLQAILPSMTEQSSRSPTFAL